MHDSNNFAVIIAENELVHCLGNDEPSFSSNVVVLSLFPRLDVAAETHNIARNINSIKAGVNMFLETSYEPSFITKLEKKNN